MMNLDNLKNRLKFLEEGSNPPRTNLNLFREVLRYHRDNGQYPQIEDLDPKNRSIIEHFFAYGFTALWPRRVGHGPSPKNDSRRRVLMNTSRM